MCEMTLFHHLADQTTAVDCSVVHRNEDLHASISWRKVMNNAHN